MSRFGNMISRAIEREQKEKQGAVADSPLETRPVETLAETISANLSEAISARVLQMPPRRLAITEAPEAKPREPQPREPQPDAPKQKPVNAETWNWSEPPAFAQQLPETNSAVSSETLERAETNVELKPAIANPAINNSVGTALALNPPQMRLTAQPVFRQVEINPENVEPHLVAITQPRSVHAEEFRNLRTRILHAAQTQKLQAIVIASGSPSEGKSTVALNLAWLLAQTDGIKALIIDSDLRLPCLADYLDVNAQIGLSEIFSGETRLEDAIMELAPSGLHLLPGGAARNDVAEMLSGNKFRHVLEQARKMFDFIIVDAPSLSTFTDAAVLINQTDAALLVVRAGKTRYATTNRLLETLPRERMLGVVVNGSNESLANESHYDGYEHQNRRKNEIRDGS